jgi:membrane-bound lytic murein transglycosylase MltF
VQPIPRAWTRTLALGLLLAAACGEADSATEERPPEAVAAALEVDPELIIAEREQRTHAAAEPEPEPLAPGPGPADSPAVARKTEPWLGDLSGMRERRTVRALVVQDRTGFFIDRGRPRGFEVELLEAWEQRLNAGASRRELRVNVVYVPVPFDEVIPALVAGRGDIAAAGLGVTEARREQVAFTTPLIRDVDELFVAHRAAPPLRSLDDLAGRRVHVQRGTSFSAHLHALSAGLAARGLAPLEIVEVDPRLDVEDLIELVHAGVFHLTVADGHVAQLWAQVLDGIVVREDLPLRDGGEIAWAVRPGSPELLASLDAFAAESRRGSLLGNVLFRRYFQNTRWIVNPVDADGLASFDRYGPLLRRYADLHRFDWLKMAAVAYQESGLNHERVSSAGAVGVMQVLPTTAAYLGFANPRDLEQNVHAGITYMALLRERVPEARTADAHFDFCLAAYNMGRGRLRQMRREARERGLDPDVWFDNVELVTLERVGQEPVRYVANVNKYYVAYTLALHDRAESQRQRPDRPPGP